jgi:hypothetical protein
MTLLYGNRYHFAVSAKCRTYRHQGVKSSVCGNEGGLSYGTTAVD